MINQVQTNDPHQRMAGEDHPCQDANYRHSAAWDCSYLPPGAFRCWFTGLGWGISGILGFIHSERIFELLHRLWLQLL